MQQPSWYHDTENWLLAKGKPVILGALLVLAVVPLYFAWEVAHDRKTIPAVVWATYMYMP